MSGSTTGFLSVIMDMANAGLDVIEPMRDGLSRLRPEMFEGQERAVFEAARLMVDARQMPTAFAVARKTGLSPLEASRIKTTGAKLFGDLRSAVGAVLQEYGQKQMIEGFALALKQAQEGQLDLARVTGAGTAEQGLLGDAESLLVDYHDYDVDAPPAPRHITFTLANLNEDIGGGLAAGGSLCMSMVAAPSGVGKSTFVMQQIPHWLLKEGHWVLYGTGEMDASYIYGQITRIHARLSESQFRLQIPRYHALLKRSNETIRSMVQQGRLTAFDSDFTPENVRELARRKARQLAEARKAGLAPETARLIVIVDNWDNLFSSMEFGDLREDQMYRAEMLRFMQQASEYGYHHMNLVQTNGDAEGLRAPAEAHQMQGSRKLNAYTSHQIVLYRPRDLRALEAVTSQGGALPDWAHPQIAVRKARGGGRTATRNYRTDERVGDWHDASVVPEF